jgi:hypothetical protein
VQVQICDILRSQLAMNRFLPLCPHRFSHFGYIHRGGGVGGALILDRCRAVDLFASVDAHLCPVAGIPAVAKFPVFFSCFPFVAVVQTAAWDIPDAGCWCLDVACLLFHDIHALAGMPSDTKALARTTRFSVFMYHCFSKNILLV